MFKSIQVLYTKRTAAQHLKNRPKHAYNNNAIRSKTNNTENSAALNRTQMQHYNVITSINT